MIQTKCTWESSMHNAHIFTQHLITLNKTFNGNLAALTYKHTVASDFPFNNICYICLENSTGNHLRIKQQVNFAMNRNSIKDLFIFTADIMKMNAVRNTQIMRYSFSFCCC